MTEADFGQILATAAKEGGKALPESRYLLQVKRSKAGVTKTGKPAFNVGLIVMDGPLAGRGGFGTFSIGTPDEFDTQKTAAFLSAIGFQLETLGTQFGTMERVAEAMVGRYAYAVATVRTFNQTERNDWSSWEPYEAPAAVAPTVPAVPAAPPATPVPTVPVAPVPVAPVTPPEGVLPPAPAFVDTEDVPF
jgi:hypothetical protein